MSKATEDELGALHGAIARSLTTVITAGVEEVVGKGEDAVVVKGPASAAYFAAAITLLKNNNITAAQGNHALDALKQALANKKNAKAPVLTKQSLEEAAELFGDMHGNSLQ
jgi:hypothetical protein